MDIRMPIPAKPTGTTWTDEQWQAIACRGCDTLVAAAAGSGKTAVLVERIIRRISDEEHPLDVDRLLVATFTNAAASEMRERIRAALEVELTRNPSSRHLRSQLALLPRAAITTLHSFCLEVIRRHTRSIGLDPGFRIANETEAELIKQELMEELVDSRFAAAAANDGFWLLADGFGGEKGDGQLFRLIGTLYEASRSHPAPAAWLNGMAARFRGGEGADAWFASLAGDVRLELSAIAGLLEQADRIAAQPAGPAPYRSGLAEEAAVIRELIGLADREWDRLQQAAQQPVFGRLKPCRGDAYDKGLVKAAQELRDAAKKRWSQMKAELFDRSRADYEEELVAMAPAMEALAGLVLDFADRFGEAKRDRGLVDFSDLEHYALQILSAGTAEDGTPLPSEAALDYRRQFEEVLLDEYQDTNRVQETIVALVAQPGSGNRFLVGDVKQSIYRFRLAEPGLFLAKYKAYRTSPGKSGNSGSARENLREDGREAAQAAERADRREAAGLRIDLARNFRSRTPVVDGVNYLFRQIMEERVGEIRYDRSAELVAGAAYPETDADLAVEALLLDKSGQAAKLDSPDGARGEENGGQGSGDAAAADSGTDTDGGRPDLESATAGDPDPDSPSDSTFAEEMGALTRQEQETARLEARLIAERIHRLMGRGGPAFPVSAKGTGQTRPPAYRDIVILLRSTAGWAPIFAEELAKADIPVYAELGTGFFSAMEVEVMLSLLKIIDNPYQDIPLAGVLHSPLFGLTSDELAQLRVRQRKGAFFDAVLAYAGKGSLSGQGGRNAADGRKEGGLGAKQGKSLAGEPEAGTIDPELAEKVAGFLQRLESWRRAARQTPVAELIWRLYRETRFYDFVGGLPGGVQRQANLRALHDRAKQYEETSYRGLFRFLRFIGRMRESGGDLGAARSLGEQEDVVKIMTIHKSKGLEFPVVFVAGLSKAFNRQDLNGAFLLHKDLGFGPKFIDLDLRVSYPSLASLAIRRRLRLEALAEEMRVLYVALTRAREKLILVGTVKDATKAAGGWLRAASGGGETLPDYELAAASCYLDWIGPALIRHPDAEALLEAAGAALALPAAADPSRWRIAVLPADLYAEDGSAAEPAAESGTAWLERLGLDSDRLSADPRLAAEVNRRLSWTYPHAAVTRLVSKTTVSELKRLSERLPAADETGETDTDGRRSIPGTPGFPASPDGDARSERPDSRGETGPNAIGSAAFRRPRFVEQRALNAAERGTVYHAVMQRLTLHPGLAEEDIVRTVQEMAARRLLTQEQAASVVPAELFRFFSTDVGRRLLFADRVRRELPFSLKLRAEELAPGAAGEDAGEPVLMQGILDCLFEDARGLVLLDYKTDALWREGASERAERYRLQLSLYARAVRDILGRDPDEIVVYFFDRAEAVSLGRLG